MAKNVQSPKPTGGGGYVFEDYVVADLFCRMLTNGIVFESDEGTISEIEFQVRGLGWHLDDALVTLESSEAQLKCAMSMKSSQ